MRRVNDNEPAMAKLRWVTLKLTDLSCASDYNLKYFP